MAVATGSAALAGYEGGASPPQTGSPIGGGASVGDCVIGIAIAVAIGIGCDAPATAAPDTTGDAIAPPMEGPPATTTGPTAEGSTTYEPATTVGIGVALGIACGIGCGCGCG